MTPSDPKKPENFLEVVKQHKWDFSIYIILAIGLFLSIFHPFVGGLIVGGVIGLYFSDAFKEMYQRFQADLVTEGIFRDFIIIAGILALLISSFGLCLGVVVGTIVRPLIPKF
jgi:hypothetical protein